MQARAAALLLTAAIACKGDGPSGTPLVQKISSSDQLISGREASGRIGDYLLSNGRVRFIVQDAGSATGWGLYGGSLIDLSRAEGADDRLQEIFYQCELRAFEPLRAEIVADGRDGKPAILRYTGRDRGIPLIDAAFTTQSLGLEITLDYVLPPDGDTLEIILRAKDVQRAGSRELACGVVLLRGDAYDGFAEGSGFDGDLPAELPYLAAASGDARSSWVFWAQSGPLSAQLEQNEVLPLTVGSRPLPGGGTLEERFFLSVGAGDVESALRERRRVLGDLTASSEVRFELSTPELPELAAASSRTVLIISREDRAITAARGDSPLVSLPAGNYRARAMLDGREVGSAELTAGAAPVTQPISISSSGVLEVTVTRADRSGTALGPTAAKLVLIRGLDAPPNGPRELEKYVAPADSLIVAAGDYTAYISRGPEYELFRQNISIPAGGKVSLGAQVSRSVDTTGWVSADLHVHMTKSVDAPASRRERVLSAVGEGLDILTSTDHDIVTDYGPMVRELGLESLLHTISGTEVSPAYGHINAMPLVPESPEAYWRVQWYRYQDAVFERVLDPAELVRELRSIAGIEYVQINHPRSGQGIFNYIRFNPETGESEKELPLADGIELLNNRGGGPFEEVLADYLGLIKAGLRMTAAGVSDAHETYDGVGYARTMIESATDDPTAIDEPALWRSLREGRVVVMSGPFVTLEVSRGGARAKIGETITSASGETIELAVRVQAPSWMDVSSYRLLENGVTIAEGALGDSDRDPADPVVRMARTFSAAPARDAFYLVIVEGAPGSTNEPVMHARARSVTNPIFVDVGGDGLSFR